ncbi:MAG: hypothetical protein EBU12_09985, partial [Microbacteriaceae bacterium]|nr:hypothetical protein [Microbacteriaceae bacterium]
NNALGVNALSSNSTGSYNIAIGNEALQANLTASNNTAVGYQALYTNTTSASQTALGYQALYNITGAFNGGNTAIGQGAGYSQTSGYSNTYVGYNSGYSMTSGIKNTILGSFSGNQGGLDIRTASNYVVLSDGDGNPRAACNGNGTWAINVGGSVINNPDTLLQFFGGGGSTTAGPLRFGDGAFGGGATNYWDIGRDNASTGNFTFTLNGSQKGYISLSTGAYTAVSDLRLKKNVVPLAYGLNEVMALNPVMYHMIDEAQDAKKHIGFIAQEVKSVIDESVDDLNDENAEFYGLDKSGLVPLLVKAIQELKAEFDAYKAAHP